MCGCRDGQSTDRRPKYVSTFPTSFLPALVLQNFSNFINEQESADIIKKSDEKYKLTFSWEHEVKIKDPDGNPSISQPAHLEGQMRILEVQNDDK